MVNSGLQRVVAATTRLSEVDGERGELIIGGFSIGELAANATFEETTWLLWHGDLPVRRASSTCSAAELAGVRALPAATIELLRECARARLDAMDALRIAAGTISMFPTNDPAVSIVASFPRIVATYLAADRRRRTARTSGRPRPRGEFPLHAQGEVPDAERVRGLETYLNTVVDHGLNASTFTARVITSTGSDLVSAVVGAIGALKGPLHGGAPGPALDMVFEIAEASRAEPIFGRRSRPATS